MMRNLGIFISESIFFSLTFLQKLKWGISNSISFLLTVINSKIVARKFMSLLDLSIAQVFCINESMEVVMIFERKDLVLVVFPVIVLRFEYVNDGSKLLIIGLVLSLSKNHLP